MSHICTAFFNRSPGFVCALFRVECTIEMASQLHKKRFAPQGRTMRVVARVRVASVLFSVCKHCERSSARPGGETLLDSTPLFACRQWAAVVDRGLGVCRAFSALALGWGRDLCLTAQAWNRVAPLALGVAWFGGSGRCGGWLEFWWWAFVVMMVWLGLILKASRTQRT